MRKSVISCPRQTVMLKSVRNDYRRGKPIKTQPDTFARQPRLALLVFLLALSTCVAQQDGAIRAGVAESGAANTNAATSASAAPAPADIDVAESALRDGLPDIAETFAKKALFSPTNADDEAKAFDVLMQIYETTMSPEKRLEMFDAPRIFDRPWEWFSSPEFARTKTFWRARTLAEAGKHDAALAQLDTLHTAPDSGTPRTRDILRLRAFSLGALGRNDDALGLFLDFYGTNTTGRAAEFPDIVFDHARVLIAAGKTTDALPLLQPLAADTNNMATAVPASLMAAYLTEDADDVKSALRMLDLAHRTGEIPTDSKALSMAHSAAILGKNGRPEEAVETAEQAATLAQSAATKLDCAMLLAELLAKSGNAPRAAETVRNILLMAPRSPAVAGTIYNVATSLLENGAYAEALDAFSLLIASFSKTEHEAAAHRGKGEALIGLERFDDAATALFAAAELTPDKGTKIDILHRVIRAQYRAQFYRRAVATADAALAMQPRDAMHGAILLLKAESLAEYDKDAAYAEFRRVAESFPQSPEAPQGLFRAALIAAENGDDHAATNLYSAVIASALATPPQKASSHLGAALIFYKQQDFTNALRRLDAAIAMPDGGSAREQAAFTRIETLFALGEDDQALQSAMAEYAKTTATPEAAQSSETATPSVWRAATVFRLGRYHFNHRQFAEAEKFFTEFAATWTAHPDVDDALLFTAYAQFEQKRPADAIKTALALAAQFPDSPNIDEARFIHAESLCELLQFDSAIFVFDTLVSDAKEFSETHLRALGRKADCLFVLGSENTARYEESIAAYKTVAQNAADLNLRLQAEYKTGRSLEKLGRLDDAFDKYYIDVIVPYEKIPANDLRHGDAATEIWYIRAIFGAVRVLEAHESWSTAATLLEKLSALDDFPGKDDAMRKLARIRDEKLKFSNDTPNAR